MIDVRRIALKALLLFLLANFVFALGDPLPALGRISLYNRLFPGRLRLPYGDNPAQSYSLSLYNLDAMFASHEISAGSKPAGEFRVVLIGDSSTWGYLLPPDKTLAAQINAMRVTLPDGRRVRAYNLGYPVMSLTKDLLLLDYARRYDPDLIVWPVTLESFPADKQLFAPLLQNNPAAMRALIEKTGILLDPADPAFVRPGLLENTLIGKRRALADLVRLQLYGVMWAATGIDHAIPAEISPLQVDLEPDPRFHELQPPHLPESALAFDVLAAGMRLAGKTPVLIVNEPMFVSQGANSDTRYNFYYPRWAYDDYRHLLAEQCATEDWRCLDAWDAIPAVEFTNTAVHMTPEGTRMLAEILIEGITGIGE